jgi:hypothetical protein
MISYIKIKQDSGLAYFVLPNDFPYNDGTDDISDFWFQINNGDWLLKSAIAYDQNNNVIGLYIA